MSLVEAIANVVVGYGIAVATQLVVFRWLGLPARIGDALAVGAICTGESIVRSPAVQAVRSAVVAGRAPIPWICALKSRIPPP